jgi:hypothetical protein
VTKLIYFEVRAKLRSLMFPLSIKATIICILLANMSAARPFTALAMMQDYTPMRPADCRRKFPLKAVVSIERLEKGEDIQVAQYHLKLKGKTDLEVSGVDKSGKPWLVASNFSPLGTTIFTGDLDKNGIVDLVIAGTTGGCGYAPPKAVDTILFDDKGRPRAWGCSSYAYADLKNGFDDLVILDGDQRAVFIQQSIVYHNVGERTLSYWRTLLYRAQAGGWQLLRQYDGRPMPLIVRFRFKPNEQLVKQIPFDLKSFQDASTVGPQGHGFKEVKIEAIKKDGQGGIQGIDFGAGFVPGDSYNDLYYGTTIFRNSPNLFQVSSISSRLGVQLLNEAYSRKCPIRIPASTLKGCQPVELWISD